MKKITTLFFLGMLFTAPAFADDFVDHHIEDFFGTPEIVLKTNMKDAADHEPFTAGWIPQSASTATSWSVNGATKFSDFGFGFFNQDTFVYSPWPNWDSIKEQGDWTIESTFTVFPTFGPVDQLTRSGNGFNYFTWDNGTDTFVIGGGPPTVTPEPVSSMLFLLGGGILVLASRRRLKSIL